MKNALDKRLQVACASIPPLLLVGGRQRLQ